MEPIYIFGHKNPDTDSVCSAIALSYLKNKLGMNTIPKVLGNINNETKFVLRHFNIPEPGYLSDVKIQIKDLNFNKEAMINENASVNDAVNLMLDSHVTGIPLIDDEKHIKGYVTLKDMARYLVRGDINKIDSSYDNIVSTLKGREVLKFDDEIVGDVLAVSFKSESFLNNVVLKSDDILIVGDRYKILESAVKHPIKLIIIVGSRTMDSELKKIAKQNKVNVIFTPYRTYETANIIKLCNYIKNICPNPNPVIVDRLEYLKEFKAKTAKHGHTNYPVINKLNECIGQIEIKNFSHYDKKKVILVDHNQALQSIEGLEEAEILEIVDHHNLGTIGTNNPINFRCVPVGCTSTIIYDLFQENKVKIPEDIAGLMLSCILSDTLLFKSPTTTNADKVVAAALAKICKEDINKYGLEMLKAGSSIKGKSVEDVLNHDLKKFSVGEDKVFIAQFNAIDFTDFKNSLDEYVEALNDLSDYKIAVLFVTDIMKNGSYIIYNQNSEDIIAESFNLKNIKEGIYVPGLISRKKQALPNILEALERRS